MKKIVLKETDIQKSIQKILKEYFDPEDEYNKVELGDDPNIRYGKEWAEKGGNFPVKRNGKTFYVSRSVSVSLYCYCQNKGGASGAY